MTPTSTAPPPPPPGTPASPPPPHATPALPPPPPPPAPTRPRRSRGGRRAWRIAGTVVAVAGLLWGTLQAVSLLAHSTDTVEVTFSAAGLSTIDVDVDHGRIRVIAADTDEVRVTAHIDNGLVATRHREEVQGDRLVLRGDCTPVLTTFCSVDYTIEAPAGLAVRARNSHDDIVLTGVDGDIDARTSNGDVRIDGGRARVIRLGSSNGDIEARQVRARELTASSSNGDVAVAFAGAPDTVRATSSNGDVEVVLPADAPSYAVDAGSGNGSRAVAVRTDPAAPRTITARSSNGDVTVAYPSS